jgi:hypothetical protein
VVTRGLLLVALVGCAAPPPVDVTVKLVFDGTNCSCASIDTCALPAAGETGELIVDDAGAVLQTTCVSTAGGTLADIPSLFAGTTTPLASGQTVAVELVVYPDVESCPQVWNGTMFTTTPGGAQPVYGGRSPATKLAGGAGLAIDVPVGCL